MKNADGNLRVGSASASVISSQLPLPQNLVPSELLLPTVLPQNLVMLLPIITLLILAPKLDDADLDAAMEALILARVFERGSAQLPAGKLEGPCLIDFSLSSPLRPPSWLSQPMRRVPPMCLCSDQQSER